MHPAEGAWHNSFCSRMELSVADDGLITGQYISVHSGSTSLQEVTGMAAKPEPASDSQGIMGCPLALAVCWRPLNQPPGEARAAWRWASTFSGQFHSAQRAVIPGQGGFQIADVLELQNALHASASAPDMAVEAPATWLQTLEFLRTPPPYAQPIGSISKLAASGTTGRDLVSGLWRDEEGATLELTADFSSGVVRGFYARSGEKLMVTGAVDSAPEEDINRAKQQALALVVQGAKASFVGGVNLAAPGDLRLLKTELKSTTWLGRFQQTAVSSALFRKL